jgi:hypothetical protein
MGVTISLFKIKDGDIIGGFTKAEWNSSSSNSYESDTDAVLFNLS